MFDCIRRESSAHKRPRTESSASARTNTVLEVHSFTSNINTSNLELADSVDHIDTTIHVSSPVWIDSTSNDGSSTDSTPLSSSVAHESDVMVIPTVSKESADNKNSNAVLATTSPGDIAQSLVFPPVQPKYVQFPTTMFSNRASCFNPIWYDTYDWLEYSVEYDACFCYPCHFFGSRDGSFSSRPESTLTTTGFKDWKHATDKNGILNDHNKCISHKQAIIAW